MKTAPNLVVFFSFITLFNSIAMVNSGSCQVNENELGMFFKNSQYRKHSSIYFKSAKAFLDYEIRSHPKGSLGYQQSTLMLQLLLKKDPIMQAPPFLDVNTCEKGDIGMLSASGRFIPYVKIFQILDEERALMKCSFDSNADDDEWSAPFLGVSEKGAVSIFRVTNKGSEEGDMFAIGILNCKKIDYYVYRNQ